MIQLRAHDAKRDSSFEDLLRSRVAICDGAMGTMLHASGVSLDLCLPELNVSRPDLVKAIHGAYISAGADVIETNTFGASRARLAHHGLDGRVVEINLAGARLAREAAALAGRPIFVAGSVSPATPSTPHQRLSAAALAGAFHDQIIALVEGGVDLLIFETFGNLDELIVAIDAAREAAPHVPLVAQLTFLDDGRTLAGQTPAQVAARLNGLHLAAIGANCTLGPQGLLEVLEELAQHTSLPLSAQPNAGSPSFADGRFQYSSDPAYFARYAQKYAQIGAVLVGGCCGTTPAHIEVVSSAVHRLEPVSRSPQRSSGRRFNPSPKAQPQPGPSRFLERLASDDFLLVGELPQPPGAASDQALRDAGLLKAAGCDAVLIGPASNTRAQVSPVSLAVLVEQRIEGLEAILSVATWERSVMSLQADLLGAYAFGVRHILCRTGAPSYLSDYPDPNGAWDVDSVGLMHLLHTMNEGRDHHGIPLAEPTAFVVGARINPTAEDFAFEVEDAQRKIDAGVHYLITPPIYDLDALDRLLAAIGPGARLPPVLVGVMPLRDYDFAEYLQNEVPDMLIPEWVLERMAGAGDRSAGVGIEIAKELVRDIRSRNRARGVVLSSPGGRVEDLTSILRRS